MKVINLLLILLFATSNLFSQESTLSEIIRRKIENDVFKSMSAKGQTIYCKKALPIFYIKRGFEPVWDNSLRKQLLTSLEKARFEGLHPNDYHFEFLKENSLLDHENSIVAAEYDMLLTDAFLLYASHLLSGKLNAKTLDADWHVSNREGNAVELLELAIATQNIQSAIETALPKHSVYAQLKKALKSYYLMNYDEWRTIKTGETIKLGMEDDRIPIIKEHLLVLDDLKIKNADSKLYDETLLAAIQKFQQRHGLESEGNIGNQTIEALNVSIDNRIQQIRANMERWRWLPQSFGDFYIIVNIANFELDVVKNNEVIRSHKIIVGKPQRNTPVFSSKMQYLVLNPTWTVPPGILNADILPGVRKDANYLNKKKLTVLDNQGNPINASTIDWSSKEVRSFTYRQPAGPDNALGAVKFMFPNSFHVYLHDTPTRDLFSKTERAFSSGCIRVENPLDLAHYLIDDEEKWSREKINSVVATKRTQTVQLKEHASVHLLYWTSWVDEKGVIHFRKDIYNRDKALIENLDRKPVVVN